MTYKLVFVQTRPSTDVDWYPESPLIKQKYIDTGKMTSSSQVLDPLTRSGTAEFPTMNDFVEFFFDSDLEAYRDACLNYNNQHGIVNSAFDRYII